MKVELKKDGSVLLIVVFIVAMLAALTIGILQMYTEEVQLMQNQIYAAQALAVAEAGLNYAFAQLRADSDWTPDTPYTTKALPPYGIYAVSYEGSPPDPNIISEATTPQGFIARVKAEITIGDNSPYVIRIDNLRVNE